MKLGSRLKAARQAAGLSQVAAAPLIGIDNSHISKIENDKDAPSLDVLARMCAVYNVKLSEILPPNHPWREMTVAATPEEKAWLEWFRSRSSEQRAALLSAIVGSNAA